MLKIVAVIGRPHPFSWWWIDMTGHWVMCDPCVKFHFLCFVVGWMVVCGPIGLNFLWPLFWVRLPCVEYFSRANQFIWFEVFFFGLSWLLYFHLCIWSPLFSIVMGYKTDYLVGWAMRDICPLGYGFWKT